MQRSTKLAKPSSGSCGDSAAAQKCLACHLEADGQLDIVGIRALSAVPPEWTFFFEDAFDLDGDGIAGRLRYASTDGLPMTGQVRPVPRRRPVRRFCADRWSCAWDRSIRARSSGRAQSSVRSPLAVPDWPFPEPAVQARLEARGWARCHVTRSFEFEGRQYMPLSDFLLHDLGEGLHRTAPLWVCPDCLTAEAHPNLN